MPKRFSPGLILACLLLQPLIASAQTSRTAHVFVALADNTYQGIVPVPKRLGNGDDPVANLYWGAAFGLKTFFSRSAEWELVSAQVNPKPGVLERVVFKHRSGDVYLVADAYRGREIRQAILDFLQTASGDSMEEISISNANARLVFPRRRADLVAYVGHNGLMDFSLPTPPEKKRATERNAIILACASKQYFANSLRSSGAYPLLWTTGLMAPEAYVLKAAVDAWSAGASPEQVRTRAAEAYNSYQKTGMKSARRLFATGW